MKIPKELNNDWKRQKMGVPCRASDIFKNGVNVPARHGLIPHLLTKLFKREKGL